VYRRFKNRSERHLIEVMVVPLSSVSGRAAHRLVQPVLSARDTLLPKDSRALCDQVRTIDKRRIRGTVGVLSAAVTIT
jgi:mRNA-degrading endonuclease toxin of MazEF toxin-antitoxin module